MRDETSKRDRIKAAIAKLDEAAVRYHELSKQGVDDDALDANDACMHKLAILCLIWNL